MTNPYHRTHRPPKQTTTDAAVRVLYVERIHAKRVKTLLEQRGWLDKDYRITTTSTAAAEAATKLPLTSIQEQEQRQVETGDTHDCFQYSPLIAIPILSSCTYETIKTSFANVSTAPSDDVNILDLINRFGHYDCPARRNPSRFGGDRLTITAIPRSTESGGFASNWGPVQQALYNTIQLFHAFQLSGKTDDNVKDLNDVEVAANAIVRSTTSELSGGCWEQEWFVSQIQHLSQKACPRHLEYLGDDHTLVLSQMALNPGDDDPIVFNQQRQQKCRQEKRQFYGAQKDASASQKPHYESSSSSSNDSAPNEFRCFLRAVIERSRQHPAIHNNKNNNRDRHNHDENVEPIERRILHLLWPELIRMHQRRQRRSRPRVIRRGRVDPNSAIRKSYYRILWPDHLEDIAETGPGSPTWITVTEQGIRQSFDLTQVMFSRGNITEKIRFGRLVQPDEIVLDLYAGIGYFTLPALVHGRSGHVFACEWNPLAVQALRYNLLDNHIAKERVTIYEGDCRQLLSDPQQQQQQQEHNQHQLPLLTDGVDRVSLGLLPSSEGGWSTAVQALRRNTGGWLHIHGNVPTIEANPTWIIWVCCRLRAFVKQAGGGRLDTWVVVATHLEQVKSFAPTVNHYVLDVCLGPVKVVAERVAWAEDAILYTLRPGDAALCLDKSGRPKDYCAVARSDMAPWIHICPPLDVDPVIPSCALSSDGVLHQQWMREITSHQ